MEKKIPEIVLTGGPCGGKTTGINYISEKLRNWGFRVFITPEVATMFINGGISDISSLNFTQKMEVEKRILLCQRALRNEFNQLAEIFNADILNNKKGVIIYDRAEMDVKAYIMQKKMYFEILLKELGLNIYDVRDSYDGIIHLVSAACGAEKFYNKENNRARQETLEEARDADERTQYAWNGHPHIRIIDNSTGFELKMKRALQATSRILGIPVPLEIERKFLLKSPMDWRSPHIKGAQQVQIEQIYLLSHPKEEIRIRKRSQGDSHAYYRTCKIKIRPGIRQEKEEAISAKEYLDLQQLRDPNFETIRKFRYCFIYKNQYFELDTFITPRKTPDILEIELTEENDKVEIPPFLDIEKEVTGDDRYSNRELARHK